VYGCGGSEQWHQGSNRDKRALRFEPGMGDIELIVVDDVEVGVERRGKCSAA
jgi:hypothetical protein